MIIRKFSSVAASLLCCGQLFSADTIVLTSGEKIDGRVVREEGDNLVLEVKVTDTINDERIVAKADVKFIEKEKEDIKAFNMIAKLVPTPSLLAKEEYEERIKAISGFVDNYPVSSQIAKAKGMLETLKEELSVIEEGGIKLDEELISAEDYDANAYEYDSMVAARKIDSAISRREFLNALRMFSDYDVKFADSASRGSLVERIQQVLKAYGSMIESSLASLDARTKRREEGLERMTDEDRTRAIKGIEEENARLDERFQAEKAAKVTWVTPDAYHKGSLEEAKRQVEAETKRLEAGLRKEEAEKPLGEVYREAWVRLSERIEDEKELLTIFNDLKSAGMPEGYILKLQERADAVKSEADAEKDAEGDAAEDADGDATEGADADAAKDADGDAAEGADADAAEDANADAAEDSEAVSTED